VLLVSSDVLIRITLARSLADAGFRVLPVAHPAEALSILKAVPGIRAVVTDAVFTSGDLSGLQLARRVRSRWNAQVLIVSSGVVETEDLTDGMCFITKPVHGATLVHLVRELISKADEPEPEPIELEPGEIPRSLSSRRPEALTPRQQEVLDLLMKGKSTNGIAEAMGLAVNTVRVHLIGVYRVLGVASRLEAALVGLQRLQIQ
jgi:DNA-binding NarL/FixJ family response regulator